MNPKSELAMLAALAIVNGTRVTRVQPGARTIAPELWYNNGGRPISKAAAEDYERRKLSATFAGTRVYKGWR